ncbi:MAG: GNAT family N-acetyltransferase [Sandarakinorhabdus sp.]|nr:GNAT family N-acetyltransferase [Sandarakinorhabdus sp.]
MIAPVFRAARLPDDAAMLVDLNTEYLRFVFDGLAAQHPVDLSDVFPGGDIRTYVADALPKIVGPGAPASAFYFVEIDGAVAGMGGVRTLRPGVAEMKRVYVRPEFRGTGLGRVLVERLIADARSFGFHTMFLDTAPTLVAARGLYTRLGFAAIPPYPEVEVPAPFHHLWVFMAMSLHAGE